MGTRRTPAVSGSAVRPQGAVVASASVLVVPVAAALGLDIQQRRQLDRAQDQYNLAHSA